MVLPFYLFFICCECNRESETSVISLYVRVLLSLLLLLLGQKKKSSDDRLTSFQKKTSHYKRPQCEFSKNQNLHPIKFSYIHPSLTRHPPYSDVHNRNVYTIIQSSSLISKPCLHSTFVFPLKLLHSATQNNQFMNILHTKCLL